MAPKVAAKIDNAKIIATHITTAAYAHRETLSIHASRDSEIMTLANNVALLHNPKLDIKERDLVDISKDLRDTLWIMIQKLVQSFEANPNLIKVLRTDPKGRNFKDLKSTLPLIPTILPELTDDTAKSIMSYVAAKKPTKTTPLDFLEPFIRDRFVQPAAGGGTQITANNQDIVDFTRVLILEFLQALAEDLTMYGIYIGSKVDYDVLVYVMRDHLQKSIFTELENLHEIEVKKRSQAAQLRKAKTDLTKKPAAVTPEVSVVESEIDAIVNAAANTAATPAIINNLP